MDNNRIPSFFSSFDSSLLDPPLREKWNDLVRSLRGMRRAAVAFSGGVDSSTLAAAAFYALGEDMLAVTIHSPVENPQDTLIASQTAHLVGFPHLVIEHNDLEDPNFTANPPDRCYFCKAVRLGVIQKAAAERGIRVLLEGSNADDAADYRPGMRAVRERGGISPLMDAGLHKAEVRKLAMALGLPIWDRPSSPCLASRFPYGSPITLEGLAKVAAGEAKLRGMGFSTVRVRIHDNLARLELPMDALAKAVEQQAAIVEAFHEIGFTYVTLDLAGFRSGSMNEVLAVPVKRDTA